MGMTNPSGKSANDDILDELCSVCYVSSDSAMGMIRSCGREAILVKCDIKSAFVRYPRDFKLLGFPFRASFILARRFP